MNIKDECTLNGGSVVRDGIRFVLNYGVDSDCVIVANESGGNLGSFIAHPGWAWWPVYTKPLHCIGYVRKDGLYAARMLREAA